MTASRGAEAIRQIAGALVTLKGDSPQVADFQGPNGTSRIWFLSADHPDSIPSFGFLGLVLDEAAQIPQQTWHQHIRPTLITGGNMGWGLLITTPRSKNWFFDTWTRGDRHPAAGGSGEYASFRFPSYTNPHFPAEEWGSAKRDMPHDVFRQEYEAEFLDDGAGVFRGVDEILLSSTPVPMSRVVIGCDLAKHTDFTRLIAMDTLSGKCVDRAGWNQLDWPLQRERIKGFVRRYNAALVMDSTGIGDVVYDELKKDLPTIWPVKLSQSSKTDIIQHLQVAIESKTIGFPREWSDVVDELKRFEWSMTEKGTLTYSAPQGFHDDWVIALGLANYGRPRFMGGLTRPMWIPFQPSLGNLPRTGRTLQ